MGDVQSEDGRIPRHGERQYSLAADRLCYALSAEPLGWIPDEDGICHDAWQAHDQHIYDGSCAYCKVGHAPLAFRRVIDAVLAAVTNDDSLLTEHAVWAREHSGSYRREGST